MIDPGLYTLFLDLNFRESSALRALSARAPDEELIPGPVDYGAVGFGVGRSGASLLVMHDMRF